MDAAAVDTAQSLPPPRQALFSPSIGHALPPISTIPFFTVNEMATVINGQRLYDFHTSVVYSAVEVGDIRTRTDITKVLRTGSFYTGTFYLETRTDGIVTNMLTTTDANASTWLVDSHSVFYFLASATRTSTHSSIDPTASGNGSSAAATGRNLPVSNTAGTGLPPWAWGVLAAAFVGVLVGVLVGFCIARRASSRRNASKKGEDGEGLPKEEEVVLSILSSEQEAKSPIVPSASTSASLGRRSSISKNTVMLNDLLAPLTETTTSSSSPSSYPEKGGASSSPYAGNGSNSDPSAPPFEKMPLSLPRAMVSHSRPQRSAPPQRSNSISSEYSLSNLPTYTEATGLPAASLRRPSQPKKECDALDEIAEEVLLVAGPIPEGVSAQPPVPASAPAAEDWAASASLAWEVDGTDPADPETMR